MFPSFRVKSESFTTETKEINEKFSLPYFLRKFVVNARDSSHKQFLSFINDK